ncbi:MAG: hypothetical protein M3Z96_06245 [Pseudomonadota bacterium]|nr:hypothetical protein [Pseudomonadota bacterium]
MPRPGVPALIETRESLDDASHGARVFMGDGQKALFPINEGDEKFHNLRRQLAEELAGVFTF